MDKLEKDTLNKEVVSTNKISYEKAILNLEFDNPLTNKEIGVILRFSYNKVKYYTKKLYDEGKLYRKLDKHSMGGVHKYSKFPTIQSEADNQQ